MFLIEDMEENDLLYEYVVLQLHLETLVIAEP